MPLNAHVLPAFHVHVVVYVEPDPGGGQPLKGRGARIIDVENRGGGQSERQQRIQPVGDEPGGADVIFLRPVPVG